MEHLWKLIEATADSDFHDLSVAAEKEWAELKDQLEEFEKQLAGEDRVIQEYPKMVGNKIVYNADEESALLDKIAGA